LANGATFGPQSFTVAAAVTITAAPSSLNFTSLTPQNVVVTGPTGSTLSATYTCAPGASMTILPTTGPSPLTITVTPVSAPTAVVAAACTITVTGAGGTLAIPVNITTTDIGISAHRRRAF
jgi:hypothetical protein